jgi:hypothetical protein
MMPVDGETSAAVQDNVDPARLRPGDEAQIVHAIGGGALADALELLGLGVAGGDDQLAAVAGGHAVAGAVLVELPLPGDAGPRHQAAGAVVDAGVDHLRIAGGGLGADALRGVQHQDFPPRLRQGARHGQADDPRPHHHAIDLIHRRPHPGR